jgi:hypothetical protein
MISQRTYRFLEGPSGQDGYVVVFETGRAGLMNDDLAVMVRPVLRNRQENNEK